MELGIKIWLKSASLQFSKFTPFSITLFRFMKISGQMLHGKIYKMSLLGPLILTPTASVILNKLEKICIFLGSF